MDTKEIIDILEGQKNSKDKYEPIPPNRLGIDFVIDDIVTLLQQGEKYKEMWEELCDRNVDDSDEYVYSWTEELFELMVNIQQKYFPKVV